MVLVGYVQDAQFDADRWLLGLLQAEVAVPVFELPTIDGLFPRLIASRIDAGMRNGIPEEDWESVVTVYDNAAEIVAFTGDESPRNMRVLLLDSDGQVVWFHDRGYSARKVLELKQAIEALGKVQGAAADFNPLPRAAPNAAEAATASAWARATDGAESG